jgi:hypothetical protein
MESGGKVTMNFNTDRREGAKLKKSRVGKFAHGAFKCFQESIKNPLGNCCSQAVIIQALISKTMELKIMLPFPFIDTLSKYKTFSPLAAGITSYKL